MSVIIRLQNLPWSANALDIRQHFQGLSIPEGGVHIVGGEQGDAFIAFSTDEDARQAMMTDGGKIKEVKLKLMLSSRTEMQKVIEQARQQSVSLQNLLQMPAPPILPTPVPTPAPAPVAVVVVPTPDPPKLPERRDSDTLSNSSKDKERRSDRKERSRSRDRDRNRRDKDRRRRSRSRDRSRRRKSRDRSRDRSKERDRKRPGRDQSDARRTSRDRTDARRDFRRGDSKDDNKNNDQNGSVPVKPPLLVNPVSATSVWAIPPGQVEAKPMGFSKAPVVPNRSAAVPVPAEVNVGRGDMDGRRIMGSGPFPTGTMRPMSSADVEPVSPFQGSRESWQGQSRPSGEMGSRFPPVDRPGGFMGSEPARTQGFGNEGSDFDGRGDFLPRGGSFRGGPFRGNPDIRRSFPPGRLGTGPGNILGPPGTMHRPSFPRGPPPGEQFARGGDRFEPYPNRFVSDRFSRASENRTYDPRVQNPGCCVEVRNIALDSGYSDIRKFFVGIYVANNAIKIINDNKGHRVGIAYMKFANIEAKDRAIKLTGKQIRGSIVEIMHLEDEIFDKAIDSFKPEMVIDISDTVEPRVDNSCLHIQDLPSYVKESDIYKLFPKFAIAEVVFSANEERKQNMAFVKFVRAEDAKNALFSNSKHMIGNVPVKVVTCGLDQLQQAKSRVTTKDSKDVGLNGSAVKDPRSRSDIEPVAKIPVGVVSDCILLKGLPYQTNDRDLLDFFSDVALVPLRIHIMLDNFNKPSGDAYCEFSSYEETIQACTKNNTMLGKQEVTVKPVLRAEMLEALGLPIQPELGPPKHMLGGPRPPFSRNFGRPMGILGNGPRMPMMGRPMGPNLMMGPGGPIPQDAPIEGFGKPGCVVALENIPFRAEVDEILEIFSDFDVTRESVIRRFNDLGMPTGDARVSFPSPPEAQRAARELRGVQIRGRPIFLNLL